MLAHGLGDRTEDDAGLPELFLEGRPDRDAVEDRIDRDLARGLALGALDARKDHLLAQRDAQTLIGGEQLGIDFVEALGFVAKLLGLA